VICERNPALIKFVKLLSVFCSDCTYFRDRPISKDKHVTLDPISSLIRKIASEILKEFENEVLGLFRAETDESTGGRQVSQCGASQTIQFT
jgi:hypothetical protein